jgi:hypothetical protein
MLSPTAFNLIIIFSSHIYISNKIFLHDLYQELVLMMDMYLIKNQLNSYPYPSKNKNKIIKYLFNKFIFF